MKRVYVVFDSPPQAARLQRLLRGYPDEVKVSRHLPGNSSFWFEPIKADFLKRLNGIIAANSANADFRLGVATAKSLPWDRFVKLKPKDFE